MLTASKQLWPFSVTASFIHRINTGIRARIRFDRHDDWLLGCHSKNFQWKFYWRWIADVSLLPAGQSQGPVQWQPPDIRSNTTLPLEWHCSHFKGGRSDWSQNSTDNILTSATFKRSERQSRRRPSLQCHTRWPQIVSSLEKWKRWLDTKIRKTGSLQG